MKLFISYRRDDSQHQADRLHLALQRVVPRKDIFIDIDGIPAGVDFVKNISDQVGQCDILLALIGPDWLLASDAQGRRRLDDPNDFVRVEIAAALAREITVAPVLLDGAQMPQRDELPSDLTGLARRNAVEVRRTSFDADTQHLIQKLALVGRGRSALKYSVLTVTIALLFGMALWKMHFDTGDTANSIISLPNIDAPFTTARKSSQKAVQSLAAANRDAAANRSDPPNTDPKPLASPPAEALLPNEEILQKVRSGLPPGDLAVSVSLNPPRSNFTEGEFISIGFRPMEDAYVVVFVYSADGSVTMLYPNDYAHGQLVKAKSTVWVGGEDQTFRIAIAPPFGTDIVHVVAFRNAADCNLLLDVLKINKATKELFLIEPVSLAQSASSLRSRGVELKSNDSENTTSSRLKKGWGDAVAKIGTQPR